MIIAISILLIFILGFLLVNVLYKQTNAYKNQFLPARKQLQGVPYNLQFVNFGSTYTMYAFNFYDELQLNGFSFAMEAQSLEIDNVLLHKYADHIQEGATVVFGLAACVAYYRYSMVVNKDLYYKLLNKAEIPSYSTKAAIRHRLPIMPKTWRRIKSLIKDADEITDIVENFPLTCSEAKAQTNMKSMVDGWINLFKLNNLKEPTERKFNLDNQEFNAELLKNMIAYCKNRKWNSVFVITPFSAELNQYFDEPFVQSALYKLMEPSVKEFNVPICDYRTHEAFQHDKASFIDGGFRMSKYGSKKFMRLLLSDIKGQTYTNENLRRP